MQYKISDLTIDDEYDVIESKKSVKDAALKMKELGIPDLVVVDSADENILGVVADFDIVTGLVAEGKSAENTKVTDIMYTIEPVTLDTPVAKAFALLRDLDVSVVPVVEDDKLLGVATIQDLWGYLSETYSDDKGLLTVSNPRFANYIFTVIMTLLYFFFGILTPIIGIAGFFKAELPVISNFSNSATYFLFETRFQSRSDLQMDTLPWQLVSGYGIIFVLVGIISAFAILQWAYADYHMITEKRNWKQIGFILGLANLLIIWLLFLILMTSGIVQVTNPQIDVMGLGLAGLAILCLAAAVYRDVVFKGRS